MPLDTLGFDPWMRGRRLWQPQGGVRGKSGPTPACWGVQVKINIRAQSFFSLGLRALYLFIPLVSPGASLPLRCLQGVECG